VLIADDSATARAQARYALDAARAPVVVRDDEPVVVEADGGVEALRQIVSGAVDLLTSELHMPRVHGLDVLSFRRTRMGPTGRAVVVTIGMSAVARARATADGAVAFCDKPLSPEGLVAALASMGR